MLNFETLASASRHLRSGQISSQELCHQVLASALVNNPLIGAYSDLLAETAQTEALASDQRRARGQPIGSLDGIPIAIKDLIDTTPAICKAGLENLSGYRPHCDADVVRSLREAGAIIIGVAETDSGAFGTRTPQVINPIEPDHVAGGSSGGSAAVVCAGLAFAALGTDTGGSIRIPSACCSISGFKPTWGRISTQGVRPLAASCDHVGPIARCVADLQMLQAVLDPTAADSQSLELPRALKIGVCEDYYRDADRTIDLAMAHVIERLERANHVVRHVAIPSPDEVIPFHLINVAKEAALYQLQTFPEAWREYPEIARQGIEMGISYSDKAYETAQRRRAVARGRVDDVFEAVDIVILPTMPLDAPERNRDSLTIGGSLTPILEAMIRYTALFNQTGHPVVSIPAHLMHDGRAISVQVIGPRNGDARLLRIVGVLERLFAVSIDYATLFQRHHVKLKSVRRKINE